MDEQKAKIPDSFKDEIKVHYSLENILSPVALISGAIHGFCDSQDISLNLTLEDLLTYGPTLSFVGMNVGITKLIINKKLTSFDSYKELSKINKNIPKVIAHIASIAVGVLYGAAYTTLGYGFGYTTGKALDYFF